MYSIPIARSTLESGAIQIPVIRKSTAPVIASRSEVTSPSIGPSSLAGTPASCGVSAQYSLP
jgi:hypothetical protein